MDYCPWCEVDGYDNVIILEIDPNKTPRCGNCLNDVTTETIERITHCADCDGHDQITQ